LCAQTFDITLKFSQNEAFYPPNLARLSDNFPTTKNVGEGQFFTATDHVSLRVGLNAQSCSCRVCVGVIVQRHPCGVTVRDRGT